MIKSHTIPYYKTFGGGDALPPIAPIYMRLRGLTFDHDIVIDMRNWASSPNEDLQQMTCSNLKIINVSRTTSLESAFRAIHAKSLDINAITSNVGSFYSMCNGADFETVFVTGLDNATNADLRYCFEGCTKLKKCEFVVDINSISTCEKMFNNCRALEYIDISGLNITASTTITNMFLNVPTTCAIYVKNTAIAIILKNAFPAYTFNVKGA